MGVAGAGADVADCVRVRGDGRCVGVGTNDAVDVACAGMGTGASAGVLVRAGEGARVGVSASSATTSFVAVLSMVGSGDARNAAECEGTEGGAVVCVGSMTVTRLGRAHGELSGASRRCCCLRFFFSRCLRSAAGLVMKSRLKASTRVAKFDCWIGGSTRTHCNAASLSFDLKKLSCCAAGKKSVC